MSRIQVPTTNEIEKAFKKAQEVSQRLPELIRLSDESDENISEQVKTAVNNVIDQLILFLNQLDRLGYVDIVVDDEHLSHFSLSKKGTLTISSAGFREKPQS